MDKSFELTNSVSQFIFNTLESQDFKLKINSIIIENVKNMLLVKTDNIFKSNLYKKVREILIIKVIDVYKSDSLKKEIKTIAFSNIKKLENNSKKLKDVIPKPLLDSIKAYILDNSSVLTKTIKKFLNSSKVQRKILLEVNNSLGGMNPLASMFINPNVIYSRISYSINSYFDDPKNNKDVAEMVVKYLESFLEKNISEVLSSVSAENKSSLIDSIIEKLSQFIITKETLESIIISIEEGFNDYVSSNNNINLTLYDKFEDIIDKNFDNVYDKIIESSNFKSTVNEFSSALVTSLLSMHIKDFIEPIMVDKSTDLH